MSKSPVRTDRSERSPEAKTSSSGDIAAFLNAARAVKPGEGGAGRHERRTLAAETDDAEARRAQGVLAQDGHEHGGERRE